MGQWKKAILEQVSTLFEGKRGPQPIDAHSDPKKGKHPGTEISTAQGQFGHGLGRGYADTYG